jgi:hypothetical protein
MWAMDHRGVRSGDDVVTAQDRVFECFPEAEARQTPAILLHGMAVPVEESFWSIFAGPDLESEELGRGKSECEAWSDAAGLRGNQAA